MKRMVKQFFYKYTLREGIMYLLLESGIFNEILKICILCTSAAFVKHLFIGKNNQKITLIRISYTPEIIKKRKYGIPVIQDLNIEKKINNTNK